MNKSSMNLEGLLTERPRAGGDPALLRSKRLSLEVDGQTYRRLRQFSLDHDLTHQAILEKALTAWLDAKS